MISRVLVPMDGSEMAEHALEYAVEVHPDAEITVLVVVGEPSAMWGEATALALADDIEQAATEHAEPVLARAHEIATEHGIEIRTEVLVGTPAREILGRVDAFDAVVIGSHGGSLTDRLLIGNVAEKVVHASSVPVTVVR